MKYKVHDLGHLGQISRRDYDGCWLWRNSPTDRWETWHWDRRITKRQVEARLRLQDIQMRAYEAGLIS